MKAQANPPSDDCGCQPIPAAGYQGLENQLYRVEIHQGGKFNQATYKWSRENASVVASITDINGAILTVNSLGPDANLGFQPNDWVELIDDTYLFGDQPNQPGVLFQIQTPGPGPLQVTLTNSATGVVDKTKNARMRRWDQSGTSAVLTGIPLSSTLTPLEYGIEVAFREDGYYVSGDYWTIPARTANGQIDWACGEHGDPFLPAKYFAIYSAPLACFHQTTTNQNSTYVQDDCRIKFPPLTWVECGDQGPCTIVPKPGIGWEAPLQALKPGADADICFPVGKFPLTNTLFLEGLGNLRLTGGGFGTQIVATGVTAAIVFSNCTSVQVAYLSASTDTVNVRRNRAGKRSVKGILDKNPNLGGTLSFADCGDVSVDSVALKCGSTLERTASCITVQNSYVPPTTLPKITRNQNQPPAITGSGEARIRHCELAVGANQEGILLVRVQRAQVEDNTLVASVSKAFTMNQRMQNRAYRALAMRTFLSGVTYVKTEAAARKRAAKLAARQAGTAPPAEAPAEPTAQPAETELPVLKAKVLTTLNYGGQTIEFETHTLLKDFWPGYLAKNAPETFATNRDLLLFMKDAVRKFLLNPKLAKGDSAIVSVLAGLDKADQLAMTRAISVGGEGIQECRILNNSIHDAIQGITVGMSNHQEDPNTRESAGTVTIAGNQIYTRLPTGAQFRACQAIFVGNVYSLMIQNNYASVIGALQPVSKEGIRVWGLFGRRIIVRDSHLAGFRAGIWFNPIEPPPNSDHLPLWLVVDNMAENARPVVVPTDAHPTSPPTPTVPPNTVPSTITETWINDLD
jgi:Family of unknown function (DUF6519)